MSNKVLCIKDMPCEERPYEKCLSFGPEALTDSELLAVVLRTGTKDADVMSISRQVISYNQEYGINNLLYRSLEEYRDMRGIGKVKAMQLVCIGEIAKRMWRRERSQTREAFNNPALCASYYMQELRCMDQEELREVFLDSRMRMISDAVITRGSVNTSTLAVREILMEAIRHKAVHIIVIHNHPSGLPQPSDADISATKRIKEACRIIGISLQDHIIIGDNQYYSFREWGTL